MKELKSEGDVYFQVKKEDEKNYIYVCWHGYINEEKAKAGMLKEIDALNETKVESILNDNQHITGPYPNSIFIWINTHWIPLAKKSGLRKVANLVSHQIFSKFSAQQLEQRIEGITYHNFENKEEAEKWLTE